MQYCTQSQFESGECSINNSIIKTQWLNDIILLDYDKFRYGSFTINSKGDMIFECSVEAAKGLRLFYRLKQDGNFYFENENGEKIPTKTIIVKNGDYSPLRYESQIFSVLLNNNEEYLISISLYEGTTEYYNLENSNYSFISTINFTNYDIHSYLGNIIEIQNGGTREYLHTFIGQEKTDRNQNNFYLTSQKYSFSSNRISLNNGYTINEQLKKRLSQMPRIVSNFKINNILVFFYLNNFDGTDNFVIELYDNNFQSKNSSTIGSIEGNYFPYRYEGIFYKGIYIKNNIGAFMFYKSNTNLVPRIRIYEINNDYTFTEKFNFDLDSPGDLNTGPILNDMIKISDKRFSFIGSSNDRTKLYIILFDFYDNDKKIKERIYKINLFDLYNYKIYRELAIISFNNFLTLSASACTTSTCDSNSNYFSFIIIFGYINGTESNINISDFLSEFNDINNNKNIIDSLLENIKIDNNIFGYEFEKQIKLITIPDELLFYNIEDGVETQVNEGGILKHDYKISQSNNVKMRNKTYYFEFQFIAQEPEINKFNEYTISIITENKIGYENNWVQENFERQTFYGKKIKIEFKLCYELCDTCQYLGISFDDQKCLTCIENYTNYNGNCYPDGYITEYITDYKTEYITDYITEKNTESITDYITEYTTEYITEYTTEYTTEYIKESDKINIETTFIKKSNDCSSIFYSKKNNECLDMCSYFDLLSDNCGIKDIENKNTIIYNLLKILMKNYTGDNLVVKAEDDYVFQLTNSLNEKNTKNGIDSNDYNLSMIDLGDCEEKLKSDNDIDPDDSLIIYKLEKVGTIASQKNIQYEVYNPNNLQKLDLSICTNEKINIFIPITLDENSLELHKDLLNNGYDLFNPNDSFYQDICAAYTSPNGTDILLSDRRAYFFNDTETACQQDCSYSKYSSETKLLKCECNANNKTIEPEPEKIEKFDGSIIFTSFYDVLKMSNFLVLKCYKLVFSYKGEYHNWGSILLIGYFVFYTIFNIMYFIKGFTYAKLYSAKMIFNNNVLNNNAKPTKNIKNEKKRSKSMLVANPLKKRIIKERKVL